MISDVFFLRKIYKGINRKKKYIPDEKYFELKYNINLLKAVSAILIFLIGFLGFNSYNNISDNLTLDFIERFKKQNKRIDSLTTKLSDYKGFVDSLKVEENETVENLDEINRKFKSINNKLQKNQESLKYTTKVFVVKGLKYVCNENINRLYFRDLKTFQNEKLPKFTTSPLVVLQGKRTHMEIWNITKDYIEVLSNMGVWDEDNPDPKFLYFDMWIAEPN
jgi:hypothetical protein